MLKPHLLEMLKEKSFLRHNQIIQWRSNLQRSSSNFFQQIKLSVERNPDFVKRMCEFFSIYPDLEPHLQRISDDLTNDPEFKTVSDYLTLPQIIGAIDIENDVSKTSLLTVIGDEKFHCEIIEFYKTLPLDQRRVVLIEEALLLHRLKYYAGSICLLYGLIEGTITETFEKTNVLVKRNGRLYKKSKKRSDEEVTGLKQKISLGAEAFQQLSEYFRTMSAYKLCVKKGSKDTISNTRNSILHGNSLDFNKEKRSAQLILWFYSVELNMKVILPVASK